MIKEVDFQKTTESAFLAYAASVAQERAIPDVRDMLKIGLRQGLYAQYSNKLIYKDKYQKAQKSVAAAMSQSYVHGDAAMYDTFIRAARPWSYRYPLEAVQGNYGNPTSPDSHAAARYVEMKAAEISNILFDGLKKDAIGNEYYPNYDDTEMIPSVFPSIGFWNIVNGCSGIAVALATSVPTFNLKEVNNALITLIRNPEASFDEIYCMPDFPCGGTIINKAAVKESLKNGKGESVRLRATLKYIPDQNMIQATELPYSVFTNTIIDQLAELVNNNESYGIDKVVDHTKKEADIRIYLSKGMNPKRMIEKLYKDTSLEYWYSINMILLDQGRFPKIFGWKQACEAYITHIHICKRREIQFDLDKALARKNIVDGLIKAYSIIDEVVTLIRSSSNPSEAASKLISTFNFNEEQAKAILAMKLSSLTKLDIVKLTTEREELEAKIEWCQHLLTDSTALDAELIHILQEVADKFGDERRTKILDIVEEEDDTDAVEEQPVNVLLFNNDTLRCIQPEELKTGKKGRKGTQIRLPKNVSIINTLNVTNLSTLSAFTSSGRMYSFSLSSLDLDQDYRINELINKDNNDTIVLLIDTSLLNFYTNLITVSAHGFIKKTPITEYLHINKKGVAAVKLEEDDTLVSVLLSADDNDKIIVSNGLTYNCYKVGLLTSTGRATKGVQGMKMTEGQQIQTAILLQKNTNYCGVLMVSQHGYGKIVPLEELAETSRGVKGFKLIDKSDDFICAMKPITNLDQQLTLIAKNKTVKMPLAEIPIQSRMTVGNRLIDTDTDNIQLILS